MVAPLYESVPPRCYGGVERVVAYLVEDLINQGHQVTLFASGDSKTSAILSSSCPQSLRLSNRFGVTQVYESLMIEQVIQHQGDFDIIHFHTDAFHLPVARRLKCPSITTVHKNLHPKWMRELYTEFKDLPLVFISDAQRRAILESIAIKRNRIIYPGLPKDLYSFEGQPGSYLVFLGRIAPFKGVHTAIEIATRVGANLVIAAKYDVRYDEYYRRIVKPLIMQSNVRETGEIDDKQKQMILGSAQALLFPIDWAEPFGLVIIEAMACGTPVIAFGRGAVPEIIDNGVTGFVVQDIEEAVNVVEQLTPAMRFECRKVFEQRFLSDYMAKQYVDFYQDIINAPS